MVSWAGLFFLGSVVVDGGRGSSGGVQDSVHLVCVVLENPGTGCPICWYYVSEVLMLRVPRSCVALGINSEWSVSCLYL